MRAKHGGGYELQIRCSGRGYEKTRGELGDLSESSSEGGTRSGTTILPHVEIAGTQPGQRVDAAY